MMEITTEVDSNDGTECLHDNRPTAGMFGSSVFCAYFTCLYMYHGLGLWRFGLVVMRRSRSTKLLIYAGPS